MLFPIDYYLHFIVGFIIAFIGWRDYRLYILGILAGAGKELFDYLDYGLFSISDMLSTFVGVGTAIYVIYVAKLFINVYRIRKQHKY